MAFPLLPFQPTIRKGTCFQSNPKRVPIDWTRPKTWRRWTVRHVSTTSSSSRNVHATRRRGRKQLVHVRTSPWRGRRLRRNVPVVVQRHQPAFLTPKRRMASCVRPFVRIHGRGRHAPLPTKTFASRASIRSKKRTASTRRGSSASIRFCRSHLDRHEGNSQLTFVNPMECSGNGRRGPRG